MSPSSLSLQEENDILRRRCRLLESVLNTISEGVRITDNASNSEYFTNKAQISLDSATLNRPQTVKRTFPLEGADFTVAIEEPCLCSEAYDLVPEIIWTANADGSVAFCNKTWLQYSGLTLAESCERDWAHHPDDVPLVKAAWKESVENLTPHEFESRIRGADGTYRWFSCRGSPILDEHGNLSKWIGCCMDIDKRKRIEDELRNSDKSLKEERRLFETTLNCLPVGVVITEAPSGEMLFLNKTFLKNWKFNWPTFTNISSMECFSEWIGFHEDGSRFKWQDWPLARSVLLGEVVAQQAIRVVFKDGTSGIMQQSSTPIYDEAGKMILATAICEDVTEMKRLEEERVNLLGREHAAHEASRLKSEFLASMSHEIRTPLNGILGMTELMMDDPSYCDVQKEQVGIIKESGEMLLVIINDILDLTRVEAGKLKLDSSPFNPALVFKNVETLLMHTAVKKRIGLSFHFVKPLPPLALGDSVRLQQVILNLVGNAVKFTLSGDVRVIVVSKIDEKKIMNLEVTVKDTGIGMTEETVAKLFTPFMQADTSTTRIFGGSGLGLMICKHLVELMKGSITVESVFGSGSKFTVNIQLPLCEAGNPVVPRRCCRQQSHSRFKDLKVLIVDDNSLNQTLAKKMLEKLSVTNVIFADNGAASLSILENERVDAIFMDCQMPILDGYSATRAIRRREAETLSKRIPIIALTASALMSDQLDCLESGMDDHIAKPFTREKLCEKLCRWT